MDAYRREGHRHDKSWLGRKARKADKRRVKAALKREVEPLPERDKAPTESPRMDAFGSDVA